jgi:hypothetical protein
MFSGIAEFSNWSGFQILCLVLSNRFHFTLNFYFLSSLAYSFQIFTFTTKNGSFNHYISSFIYMLVTSVSFLHSLSFLYYQVSLWGGLILKAHNTLFRFGKMKSFRRACLLYRKLNGLFYILQSSPCERSEQGGSKF